MQLYPGISSNLWVSLLAFTQVDHFATPSWGLPVLMEIEKHPPGGPPKQIEPYSVGVGSPHEPLLGTRDLSNIHLGGYLFVGGHRLTSIIPLQPRMAPSAPRAASVCSENPRPVAAPWKITLDHPGKELVQSYPWSRASCKTKTRLSHFKNLQFHYTNV